MELLPRPHSYDVAKVEGLEPLISVKIQRVNQRRKNSWRVEVLVDSVAMFTGHRDTKSIAESLGASMLKTYAEVHYHQR
jgi:hypothetical protein